jgi:hypothetical protein
VRTGAGLRVDGRFARSRGANARWTVTDHCDRTRLTVRSGKVRILGRGVLRAPHARTVRR